MGGIRGKSTQQNLAGKVSYTNSFKSAAILPPVMVECNLCFDDAEWWGAFDDGSTGIFCDEHKTQLEGDLEASTLSESQFVPLEVVGRADKIEKVEELAQDLRSIIRAEGVDDGLSSEFHDLLSEAAIAVEEVARVERHKRDERIDRWSNNER